VRKTPARETIVGLETTRLSRAGESIPVKISIAPVRDDLQGLAGSITVLEDITDRKRIEAELGRLESRVQQAQRMEVLGRLAG